jgi:hypothetical protein
MRMNWECIAGTRPMAKTDSVPSLSLRMHLVEQQDEVHTTSTCSDIYKSTI